MARTPRRRWLALALALAASPAFAQDSDLIARAKLLRQVAEQKAEADVAQAVQDADRAATVSKPAAVRSLKAVITTLDKSADIGGTKRAALVKQVEAKIALLEGKPAPAQAAPAAAVVLAAVEQEAKDVREAVKEVGQLYDANRFADAQAKITALQKKYPNNPAALALAGQGTIRDRVAESKELARLQGDGNLFALNDVQRSAVPATGDITFPADYKAKMERRDRLAAVQLGPEEEAILAALEKTVGNGLKDQPFEEVVQSIASLIGKEIVIDPAALAEDNRDLKKPVSMPGNVSARTALRVVVQSLGMTFVIKEKVIQVVTYEEARKMLVKRAYYLGDVLTSPIGGGATIGPVADFLQANQIAASIVDSIKRSIDPNVWQGSGGFATVEFHAPSLSIIVSAPAEVHFNIHGAMKRK